MNEVIITDSPEETMSFARRFAATLRKGSVVALFGDLGTGKSVFCKGIASGFGISEAEVRSPSFTILNVYMGEDITINHFDLYRISDTDELTYLGFDDHIYSDAVSLIEWSERIAEDLPEHAVRVYMEQTGDDSRKIRIVR